MVGDGGPQHAPRAAVDEALEVGEDPPLQHGIQDPPVGPVPPDEQHPRHRPRHYPQMASLAPPCLDTVPRKSANISSRYIDAIHRTDIKRRTRDRARHPGPAEGADHARVPAEEEALGDPGPLLAGVLRIAVPRAEAAPAGGRRGDGLPPG